MSDHEQTFLDGVAKIGASFPALRFRVISSVEVRRGGGRPASESVKELIARSETDGHADPYIGFVYNLPAGGVWYAELVNGSLRQVGSTGCKDVGDAVGQLQRWCRNRAVDLRRQADQIDRFGGQDG